MNTDYLLQLAYQRLQADHNDGAIDALRQLLASDPHSAEAHALLGICLMNMRRVHAARHEVQLALAADAQLPLAHYAAAQVAIALRKFKLAQEHLNQLLDMEPLNPVNYRCLAELYQLTGRLAQSREPLEKALELAPDDAANLVALAEFYRACGDWNKAQLFARQALQADPGNTGAVVVLGHLLLREGDVNGARDHAIWALQENATSLPALHLLTAVKARSSVLLGAWWRFNSWMNERSATRAIILLLFMFVAYRVVVITLTAHGYPQVAQVIDWVWLAFAAYTFAAPQIFRRLLDKELVQVKLSKEF
ncbi:tetratricopeptide repeat protein [Pseudomonas sp. CBSPBW29]|uniref:tetratricopeptide repeat protein n=1 Tax=Pseudomonas TaxID=286 RepID=UPI0021ABFBC4|nr:MULTISPECIES: tetratricopeptide repeat protein [unclassified Pseudomonas]WEL43998.1 tetratricopeptide repeat protein [Pseudomonas sp. CBSPBW29]WEL65069.1 tetratricopeptide repeat protein [Pseudomonas sp. CBSPGW29]WEL68539.1 tetratricopeptide repeat protein [Pseudomonas sp. CBSPCGW29]WEL75557.1 tetratricopeptide repeat protein [Pseudomonas sp. CBSPAW29]WEL80204.1 tetratricopeptide repeat protein [Pseudomonas sp. CBSPCAW29]WEL88719.1 tetratricopeptide repeat protein [Pseudomonas sp. CBSPCBW2